LEQAGVGVEHYAAHGVIRLGYDEKDKTVGRKLRIVKMTITMHSIDVIPYEITVQGLNLRYERTALFIPTSEIVNCSHTRIDLSPFSNQSLGFASCKV
jgi:KaiC/GvpD/RAD55 family RecA-like ATPase